MEELRSNGFCRPLGLLEQRLTARTLNGFYNNFTLIATYNIELPPAVVFSTLRKMILSHSILSTNYSSKSNEIQPVPEILFKDVASFEHREVFDVDLLLHEIENHKFKLDSNEPVFKVMVINGNVLAVIFDHSYTDGGSGTNFHEIFLKLINEVSEEEESLEVNGESILFNFQQDMKQMAKLPLPLELTLDVFPDQKFLMSKWIKPKLPNILKGLVNDHSYNKVPSVDVNGDPVVKWPGLQPSLNYNTLFKVFNIRKNESDRLIKIARSKKITITPIVEVVFLQSLVISNAIQNQDLSYYIDSMLPINLRRHIRQDLQEMSAIGARVFPGIHNNICVSDLARSQTDKDLFWKLCQQCFETISNTSSDPRAVMNAYINQTSIHGDRSIEEIKTASSDEFAKNTGVSTRFSNLGLFKNPQRASKYVVEDMVFSQSIGMNGGVFVLNIISTENGGINFCVTCLDGVFEKNQKKFADLCDLFKKSILELIY